MMFRPVSLWCLFLIICWSGTLTAEEEYWEYTFRPGDSIWKIAKQYTNSVTNWSEIQQINQIRQGPDRKIQPGTRIVIPVSMLKNQPTPAKVIAIRGDVRLKRANGDNEKLEVGTLLYSGDRVNTGDGQSLRMQFADKSELQVLPDSEVVLDKLSFNKKNGMVDTRLRLNTGGINTWVEKQNSKSRYEITTPAAITAVRGTVFRLSSDASQTSRTEVTEGIVGVSASNIEKAVRDGFGLVAEKGKSLPDPVKLLPAPVISTNLSADATVVRLSWEKLEGARFYRYQLALDEKFNQITTEISAQESTVEFKQLQSGRYYLRVRGVDQFKLEGLDSVSNFTIKQPPASDDSLLKIIIPAEILLINL